MQWPSKDWRDYQDDAPSGRRSRRRDPHELSIAECFATFVVLVPIMCAVGLVADFDEPIGGAILYSALLVRVVDWIVQGWRKSASGDPA